MWVYKWFELVWEGMRGVRVAEGDRLEGAVEIVWSSLWLRAAPWFGLLSVTLGLSVADS